MSRRIIVVVVAAAAAATTTTGGGSEGTRKSTSDNLFIFRMILPTPFPMDGKRSTQSFFVIVVITIVIVISRRITIQLALVKLQQNVIDIGVLSKSWNALQTGCGYLFYPRPRI